MVDNFPIKPLELLSPRQIIAIHFDKQTRFYGERNPKYSLIRVPLPDTSLERRGLHFSQREINEMLQWGYTAMEQMIHDGTAFHSEVIHLLSEDQMVGQLNRILQLILKRQKKQKNKP